MKIELKDGKKYMAKTSFWRPFLIPVKRNYSALEILFELEIKSHNRPNKL